MSDLQDKINEFMCCEFAGCYIEDTEYGEILTLSFYGPEDGVKQEIQIESYPPDYGFAALGLYKDNR